MYTNNGSEKILQVAQGLQRAIDNNRFRVRYIPVLDTAAPDVPVFVISINIEDSRGKFIPYSLLRKLAEVSNLGLKLDRWLVSRAQLDLKTLHRTEPNARLFVPQSKMTLGASDYASWLERQQQLNEVTGRGLVLTFRLSEVSKNLSNARRLVSSLKKLDLGSCLSYFPNHPTALKILELLGSEYVEVSPDLLQTDDETIDHLIHAIHELSSTILLSGIDEQDKISLNWSEGADMLCGNYIHEETDNLAFAFPPVIT